MRAYSDPEIRKPFHRWLSKLHRHDEGTQILHELKIPRPSGRIDVAVINGELSGFEIKSDVDSLVRLSRQSYAFDAVFDRVFVVTTARHISAARARVPDWWGIILRERTTADFEIVQRSSRNAHSTAYAQLQMLSCKELQRIIKIKKLIEPDNDISFRGRRANLIATIFDVCSDDEIRSNVRMALKERAL